MSCNTVTTTPTYTPSAAPVAPVFTAFVAPGHLITESGLPIITESGLEIST